MPQLRRLLLSRLLLANPTHDELEIYLIQFRMQCLDQPGPVHHCHSLGALTGEIDLVSRSRSEAPNARELGRTPEFQDLKASDANTAY